MARFKARAFEPRMFPKGVNRLEGVRFDSDCVMAPVFKQDLHYGAVFVYMQRRFGFPNEVSDDYKELARWSITTPLPDMILYVRPTLSAMLELTFSFLAPPSVEQASSDWLCTEMAAWDKAMHAWIHSQGLPVWWESIDRIFDDDTRAWLFDGVAFKDASFEFIFSSLVFGRPMEVAGTTFDALNWANERRASYVCAFGPRPEPRTRPLNLDDWATDDPLKPYALAARTTLEDLLSPVAVRDSSINIYGEQSNPGPRVLPMAPGSGSIVGCLANADLHVAHKLAWTIGQLGNGSHKRGMERALLLLTPQIEKKSVSRKARVESVGTGIE